MIKITAANEAFPKNFRRITDQIYGGGAPSPEFLSFFKNSLGGKTVLSLDAGVSDEIEPFIERLRLNHITLSLSSHDPTLNSNLLQLLNLIKDDFLNKNQPLYIHCIHGRDRTGLMVAFFEILKKHKTYEEALKNVKKYGYGKGAAKNTLSLWNKILQFADKKRQEEDNIDIASVIDTDMVQEMRDDFQMGDVAPAFMPQQSFAPKVDVRNQFSTLLREPAQGLPTTKNKRKEILQQMIDEIGGEGDKIPMVGQYNNVGPSRGFGLVENSGILQNI